MTLNPRHARLRKLAILLWCLFFAGESHAQYCTPAFGTGCTSGDDINTFVLQGINNTAIADTNTGCSSGAYDNRISESVTLAAGSSYTGYINTSFTSPDENTEIFIDFDNNGSFGVGESVGGVNGFGQSGTAFTVAIPAGAASGSHRMRVVLSFDFTYPGISPCPVNTSFYSYGEVHDYTVVIGSTATCNAPTGLAASSVTSSSAALAWSAVSGSAGYEYVLNQTAANPVGAGTPVTATSFNATALTPSTTYYFHLRNKCSATSFSTWTTVSFTTQAAVCNAPATMSTTGIAAHSATLSWPAVAGATGYEYAVTTAATAPTSGTPIITNTAAITGLSPLTLYHAYVRTRCGISNFSGWAATTFTTTAATGINTLNGTEGQLLIISPNPVLSVLKVVQNNSVPVNIAVSLLDITGKVLDLKSFNTREEYVDMSSYAAGIYFLKVNIGSEIQTLKVIRQ